MIQLIGKNGREILEKHLLEKDKKGVKIFLSTTIQIEKPRYTVDTVSRKVDTVNRKVDTVSRKVDTLNGKHF